MAWWDRQEPMQPPLWRDRRQAGVALARRLQHWQGHPEALVIGLPRGGVVVAAEVAQALQLPLASWAVRKLAHPSSPELAVGAIAPGGVLLWEEPYLRQLHLDPPLRRRLIADQDEELRRRQRLYGDPEASTLRCRPLLVVDDGVATGLTVRAALQSLRQASPSQLVLAVPVIDRQVQQRLEAAVDQVVTLASVDNLGAVGMWFDRFEPVSDQEVLDLLAAGRPVQR
jgi:putative phosphoribosyl transferase